LKEVHPLGKSPVVTIDLHDGIKPVVLAESAAIVEYFADYQAKDTSWIPKRYQHGKEGQIGGETDSWLRYRMLMHYAEGSLMPLMLLSYVPPHSDIQLTTEPIVMIRARLIVSSE
jgi:glutathione S-transferase